MKPAYCKYMCYSIVSVKLIHFIIYFWFISKNYSIKKSFCFVICNFFIYIIYFIFYFRHYIFNWVFLPCNYYFAGFTSVCNSVWFVISIRIKHSFISCLFKFSYTSAYFYYKAFFYENFIIIYIYNYIFVRISIFCFYFTFF